MIAETEERFDGALTIERTRYGDGVIVFSLAGELDFAVAEATRQVLEPALTEPDAMVVLDLTGLEFIGVKGVTLLYELARARPDGQSLRLLPSRHDGVNRVLRLTGIDEAFPTAST